VGKERMSTVLVVLALWLSVNVAFVALRLYVTSESTSRSKPYFFGRPRHLHPTSTH
jgi:hypothetical protein